MVGEENARFQRSRRAHMGVIVMDVWSGCGIVNPAP